MSQTATSPAEKSSASAPDAVSNARILFYVYPTAFQAPGGGEILLLKTKEYLEKQKVSVKLFDPWSDKLKSFHILHTFGSVKDCLSVMRTAKVLGVKNVLSTICWYDWKSAWGISGTIKNKIGAVARHFAKSAFPFIPSMRKEMMDLSNLLLPNSKSEAEQLTRYFRVPQEKISIIPIGVDPWFAQAKPEPFIEKFGLKDFILCTGRIEPRKNQLNMIRALKGSKIPLVFIGDYVPQYKSYYERCRKEADKNMHFLGPILHDSELLASAYAACNTFLLASWLETPGIAALEASLSGAKLVITERGATREYFSDYASYVSPSDLRQIRKATLSACEQPKGNLLKEHIYQNFLWQHSVDKVLAAYSKIPN